MKKILIAAATAVLLVGTAQPAHAASYTTVASSKFSVAAKSGEIEKKYGRTFWTLNKANSKGLWSEKNVSVHDGYLDLKAKDGVGGYAAFEPNGQSITYGRFEYSIKVTGGKGYKFAGLIWPTNDEWSEGELDFPEGHTNGYMHVYHHTMNCGLWDSPNQYCGNEVTVDTKTKFNDGKWHKIKVEWTPTSVTYYLDAKKLKTVKTSVPKTPHRLTLQLQKREGKMKRETTHVKIGSYKISQYKP